MKNTQRLTTMCFAILLGAGLAACSSEPSESDIQETVAKEQKATPEIMQGLVPEIVSVKKIGCKSDSGQAYICDLEVEAKQFGSVTKGVNPVRFVKTSDGWAITR
jgi:hypothetical protein